MVRVRTGSSRYLVAAVLAGLLVACGGGGGTIEGIPGDIPAPPGPAEAVERQAGVWDLKGAQGSSSATALASHYSEEMPAAGWTLKAEDAVTESVGVQFGAQTWEKGSEVVGFGFFSDNEELWLMVATCPPASAKMCADPSTGLI